jgi:Right handed beta helix region
MFVDLPITVLPTATTSRSRGTNCNNRPTASILLPIFLTLASFGANAQAVQPPLSWNDPLFNSVTSSGAVVLSSGGTISNKSITADGGQASVQCNGACTISNVRISSREAVRVGGSGNVNIDKSWIEATGQSGDHADGIQAYAPGSKGTVTIKNSSIVAHNNNATAGMFVADNYTGTFVFENVIFNGGPYGLRIHPDTGGDNYISLKDVYFVGPYLYGPFLFQNVSGHVNRFTRWENVRYATIVNGALVPGSLIPCPDAANCPAPGTQLSAPTNLRIN